MSVLNPKPGGPAVRTMAAMLRDSEERFAALFEHSEMGIALVEPDGTLLRVNPAWSELSGRSASELKGWRLKDLITPADPELYDMEESLLWAGELPQSDCTGWSTI